MRKILWYNSLFANKNGKLKPSNCNMQKKKKKKKEIDVFKNHRHRRIFLFQIRTNNYHLSFSNVVNNYLIEQNF